MGHPGLYNKNQIRDKTLTGSYFFGNRRGGRVARLWYWIRKTVLHAKECSKCCIMCEYYEVCKNDGTLE